MDRQSASFAAAALTPHSLRSQLLGEAHARPFDVLRPPLHLSHVALYTGTQGSAEIELEPVRTLARTLACPEPPAAVNHWVMEASDFRVRWERHKEFVTYTVVTPAHTNEPFAVHPVDALPEAWLRALPGELLAACHLSLLPGIPIGDTPDAVTHHFDATTLAGAACAGDAASVWTDFHPGSDGFIRFLVLDHGLRFAQAGRVVQRVLEIETYRMMALLGFPRARELGPELDDLEATLSDVTDRMAAVADPDDERELLAEISHLSARVEHTIARTNFRFSATEAYAELVRRRIDALRERRLEGVSTIDEFMERRFAPAMTTCRAASERLDRLSRRVARAADLLRTRVDVALEAQNRDLLTSMNRRARLQLRLQETVEGLSVVILSYYTVSLLGYGAKAVKAGGVALNAELATGLSIPLVVAAVAIGVTRMRRRVQADEGGE